MIPSFRGTRWDLYRQVRYECSKPFNRFHARIGARFALAYPEVQLEIVAEDRVVDLVEEAYDLVIRINPSPEERLVGRCFLNDERLIVAAPGVPIPLFASDPGAVPTFALVFPLMTAAWCGLGYALVRNPAFGRLAWLQKQQRLDHDLQPADRVTPANIAEYVGELRRLNASSTATARIRHLYCVLRAMAPDRDWTWLLDIESRLRRTATNAHDKAARLEASSDLFAYGVELMEQADGPSGGSSFTRAQGFRDGLIIALLATRPLRRRNFAAIEVGRHLIRQGDGYWLRFSATETKTRRAIALPFPSVLVPFLERYLSHAW